MSTRDDDIQDDDIQDYLDSVHFGHGAPGGRAGNAPAADELEAYELLYQALRAEPQGALPSDFADRVVAKAFLVPAARPGIEEIVAPVLGVGIVAYAITWLLARPGVLAAVARVPDAISGSVPVPLLAGAVATFLLVWAADKGIARVAHGEGSSA